MAVGSIIFGVFVLVDFRGSELAHAAFMSIYTKRDKFSTANSPVHTPLASPL